MSALCRRRTERQYSAAGALGVLLIAGAVGAPTAGAATQLVSRTPAGAAGNGASGWPTLSADGSRVAFQSKARDMVPGVVQAAGVNEVFVWDAASGEVKLGALTNVAAPSGLPPIPPDGPTTAPSITADGNRVAFTSGASNILGIDSTPLGGTFVSTLGAHSTVALAYKDASGEMSSYAGLGQLSGDGNWAIFQTSHIAASELLSPVPNLPPLGYAIFRTPAVVNPSAQKNRLINHIPGSLSPNTLSTDNSTEGLRGVTQSSDGSRVVFTSNATNLALGVTPIGVHNIYVWDSATDRVQLVSRASGVDGAPANEESYSGSISADGRYVSFQSRAANLDPTIAAGWAAFDANPDPNAPAPFAVEQVYVRDLEAQTTTLVSRVSGPDGAPADAPAGTYAESRQDGTSISGDGRFVTFASAATNLSADDCRNHHYIDVFIRDRSLNTTALVSRAASSSIGFCGNSTGVEGDSDSAHLSADGSKIAFVSTGANVVAAANPARRSLVVEADNPLFGGATPTTTTPTTPTTGPEPTPVASVPPDASLPLKDTTAPTLNQLKVDPVAFTTLKAKGAKLAVRLAAAKPKRGGSITFTASEAGTVRFVVATAAVPARKPPKRKAKPSKPVGSFTSPATSGANRVAFSGLIGRKALAPGRYALTAIATDEAGNASLTATATFKILAG